MKGAAATTIVCLSALLTSLPVVGPAWATPSGHARSGHSDASVPSRERDQVDEDTEMLAVTSVSPWVTANGTFQVTFATAGLPPDSVVTSTIHQRLRSDDAPLRQVTESRMSGDAVPRNLQAPITEPLANFDTRKGSATLQIPIRPSGGDSKRQLVPTSGIHPVTVEVARPNGDVVASATVFLNRLPEEPTTGRDGRPATTSVQLLATLDSGPALGPDGQLGLTTEQSLAVSAWEVMLAENRDLPLTVAMRPNTLLGLQRSDEPSGAAFVADLADTEFTFAAQTYVKVDAAAIAATDGDALDHQLSRGAGILRDLTGAPAAGIWMFDDTVDTEAAKRLAGHGIRHLIISADRLALPSEVDRDMRSALEDERTLQLAEVDTMTVSSYDAEVTRLLLEPDLPAGLRAHRGVTALVASWFDAVEQGADSFPGVSSAIVLSPRTDHQVLSEFVSALSDPGPLGISAPPAATVDDGAPLSARLRQRETDSVSGVVDRWRATATRIAGYGSMSSPTDPAVVEWDLLNDQTPAVDADAQTRSALWTNIDAALDERLAMIQTPPPRSVVLTSRTGSIPLRIRNRGETPVTVHMTTRSPRLEFPGGADRDIMLDPGENRIDIPVEVRAPGSSMMRIELTSPDGVLDVREVQVTVRSSSVSGVGAALSIISLIVLGVWWIRTFRRRRDTGTGTGDGDGRSEHGAADVDAERAADPGATDA